jgi:hypothetical protein
MSVNALASFIVLLQVIKLCIAAQESKLKDLLTWQRQLTDALRDRNDRPDRRA